MLAIGVVFYRRTHSVADYVLGGRSLGAFPTALSAVASDFSGWLLLGLPGFALTAGMEASWMALGLFLGTALNWSLVARRLRIYSERAGDAVTVPTFLEARLEDHSGIIRLVLSLFILFFFLFYTSSGLVAGGKLFSTAFGVEYRVAVLIGASVVVSYTLIGGYLAVSWTDVIQGLLMLGALVLVPLFALGQLGGLSGLGNTLAEQSPHYGSWLTRPDGSAIGALAIASAMAWGLGYFGQPHIVSRFMGIRAASAVPRARRIAITWSAVSMSFAIATGLVGAAIFRGDAALADAETVFLELISLVFHPLVAGVLLAAVMAAIMSTADSQLLIASSAFTSDLFLKWIQPGASEARALAVGRAAVLVLAIVAAAVALDPESSVLGIVSYAWAGLGATCGPVLLISLNWRRTNRHGALAGIVAGGIATVVWNKSSGGIFDVYELLPAFVLASASVVAVSLATPAPSPAALQLFDEVERECRA